MTRSPSQALRLRSRQWRTAADLVRRHFIAIPIRRLLWLSHILVATHSCMSHDSFMYESWLIHVWVMTHSCMSHDSFIQCIAPCLIVSNNGMCYLNETNNTTSLTHSYTNHGRMTRSKKNHDWFMRLWVITHSYVRTGSCHTLSVGYRERDSFYWIIVQTCDAGLHPSRHCNTLQRTASHCNTLQHRVMM